MSNQVYASRSHHNLRSHSHYSAAPSSSTRNPSHAGERYAQVDEYGHRQTNRVRQAEAPRSLRQVASSSRLEARQVYREDMPPPPVPAQRKRLPPAPASHHHHHQQERYHPQQQQSSIPYAPPASSSRLETYDRIPSLSSSRSLPPTEPARRPNPTKNTGDHQAVLDRMRQNGWHGVGGGGESSASLDGMSQRSASSSSLSSSKEVQSSSLSKVDSGYSEEIDGEDKTTGEKVLEGWSALKKAVAGFAGEGGASNTQGAQMWNRLTTTLAASVGTVNDAWNAEDDGSIGPDGETKLGRAIKSYHLSRIKSADDVPEWLLNDSERAQYHRRKLSHARSTQEFNQSTASHSLRERPVPRQYHSEEQLPSRRMNSLGGEPQANGPGGVGGVGGRGSAADRLARMREERRMRANAI